MSVQFPTNRVQNLSVCSQDDLVTPVEQQLTCDPAINPTIRSCDDLTWNGPLNVGLVRVESPETIDPVRIVPELDRDVAPVEAFAEEDEGSELHLRPLTAKQPEAMRAQSADFVHLKVANACA
jgi:hypothetical protein